MRVRADPRGVSEEIARARSTRSARGGYAKQLAAENQRAALRRAWALLDVVETFEASGASYSEMVRSLNTTGVPTPSGAGRWHKKTLQRLVVRARLIRSAP